MADRVLSALLALALLVGGLLVAALRRGAPGTLPLATSLSDPGDPQATVRRAADAHLAELSLDGRMRSRVSLDRRDPR